ncbi:MAG: globin [Sandaracinaceae bacterium]|jgi:truncated hemoglobin YjbI|nr:globin [Sandaracinaceae bacterium]
MVPPDSLPVFQASLERCLGDSTFTQRFYARFLLSSDEVAQRFAHVDLKRQSNVLRSSLYLVLRGAMGYEDGREHLENVAHTHGRLGIDIPRHLYDYWLDCLVLAARETDPHFGPDHERHWRACLEPCIAVVTKTHP